MFVPLQFSALNALHHTPFVYISILSPLHDAVPQFCRNKTNTLMCRFVYTGSQNHCALKRQWRCTVLTVGKSHHTHTHTHTQTERSRWLHDPVSVQKLSISVLSTSCAAYLFTDTH